MSPPASLLSTTDSTTSRTPSCGSKMALTRDTAEAAASSAASAPPRAATKPWSSTRPSDMVCSGWSHPVSRPHGGAPVCSCSPRRDGSH
eukprot:scaffold81059_cov60-Phaeocystis_antarctica.AAC.1